MKNTLLKTSLLSLPLLSMYGCGVEDVQQPNVIFIYADDLGRGMLSHFGQEIIDTPNIDRLFNEGTYFTHAYGCSYSAPARGSMLTGYSDCRKGLWNISSAGNYKYIETEADFVKYEAEAEAKRVKLPAGDLVLPQVFKRAGYVTGQVGKLSWGFQATRQQMKEHEWDYYYGFLDHAHGHVFYPHYLFESGNMVEIAGNTHPTSGRGFEFESPYHYTERWNMEGKEQYSQELFLDKVLGFIRENKDKPFFLYHPTQLPHGPVAIPKVHAQVKDHPELSDIEKEYASMVIMLDEHVGRIWDELEELGIADNTMIVFSTDNGHETYYTNDNRAVKRPNQDMNGKPFDTWDYAYTSERTGDRFNGNNGMSGKKWSNLDGGVNVPLVFHWKGHVPTNVESKQVVANYDLLTTFADMLNVELTTEKDGESLLPIIFDGKAMLPDYRYVTVGSTDGAMIVDSEGWKLRYNKKKDSYKLHYLPADYTESTNTVNPEKEKQLKGYLGQFDN